jgi:protein-disulfide isomerase
MKLLISLLAFPIVFAWASSDSTVRFPVLNPGAQEPKVTIEVFADFQCPFCKRGSGVEKEILAKYGDKVQIVFRNNPLEKIHPNARPAALAGICAQTQGKFIEMHDALYANQDKLGNDLYIQLAQDLKMNVGGFEKCLASDEATRILETDLAEAKAEMVNGTPTYFLHSTGDSVRLNGSYPVEKFQEEIDKLLQ